MNQLEIEKQFKKDFGMTLDAATRKHNQNKRNSDEVYALKMALNGVDFVTGEKISLSEMMGFFYSHKITQPILAYPFKYKTPSTLVRIPQTI